MGEQADWQIQDGFDALALGEDDNDCVECYCGVELVTEGKWAGFHFDGVGYRECSAHPAEAPAQEETHAPDCALALNARHGCTCHVSAHPGAQEEDR